MISKICLLSEKIGGPEQFKKVRKPGRINFNPISWILASAVTSYDRTTQKVISGKFPGSFRDLFRKFLRNVQNISGTFLGFFQMVSCFVSFPLNPKDCLTKYYFYIFNLFLGGCLEVYWGVFWGYVGCILGCVWGCFGGVFVVCWEVFRG